MSRSYYSRDDLDFDELTIRLDLTLPISDFEIPQIGAKLRLGYQIYFDILHYYYETPRIIHTTGKVCDNIPGYIVDAIQKKFHIFWNGKLFRTEYILNIQLQEDGSFIFGPFGA